MKIFPGTGFFPYNSPMQSETILPPASSFRETPLCPLFGECGGCAYQHLPYEEELRVKTDILKSTMTAALGVDAAIFKPIIPSPKAYGYRHRLDLTFRKTKAGEFLMGFMAENRKKVLELEACPIAMEAVSSYLPRLRTEAIRRLPENYNTANLVLRTGADGRVLWGGIGRHSLRMAPADYFWTEIEGKKIYYSLETFFQANLAILPSVIQIVRAQIDLRPQDLFLDLYSGVGLFGFLLAGEAGRVIMMEDCPGSVTLARYNAAQLGLEAKVEILEAKVEDKLAERLETFGGMPAKAMIDPPRGGLADGARQTLSALGRDGRLERLLYLSCYPPTLIRDLRELLVAGWKLEAVTPLDFFPRTRHLETLVVLKPGTGVA
ncbi:MAG: hypothetical protein A2Y02_03050 [Omnitrophica bacterium GWA2_52_12]|nr:MAG: hypothetical protein A2Y02_03050 [Omnitrophica bacterium GWA2_52_12]